MPQNDLLKQLNAGWKQTYPENEFNLQHSQCTGKSTVKLYYY